MEAAPRTRRYKNILTSPPTNVAPPISIPPDGTTQVGSGLSSPLRKLHPAHLTHPSPHRIPPSVPRIRREGRERDRRQTCHCRECSDRNVCPVNRKSKAEGEGEGITIHFKMPAAAASTTEVTRSKISDLAGRTEEVLLLLVKDNEDLRWVGSLVVLRCILGANCDEPDGNVKEISLKH